MNENSELNSARGNWLEAFLIVESNFKVQIDLLLFAACFGNDTKFNDSLFVRLNVFLGFLQADHIRVWDDFEDLEHVLVAVIINPNFTSSFY